MMKITNSLKLLFILVLLISIGCAKYLDVPFVGDWNLIAHPKINYSNNMLFKDKFDFEGKLAWRTRLGKPLQASPIPVDNFLLIGSPSRRIYCLDINSGEVVDKLWLDISVTQEVFYKDGLIFATGDDDWNKLIVLDVIRDEVLWEKSAAASLVPPIAYEGNLYFTTRIGKLFCIDPESGNKKWEFNLNDIVNTVPLFWDNRIMLTNLRGDIFVLDADSGTVIDQLLKTGDISSFPVKHESYLIVPYIDGTIRLFTASGLEKVTEINTGSEYLTSPIVENNLLYVISKEGILYCIDYDENQITWQINLEDIYVATPIIVDDIIFAGSINKRIYAYSKEDGSKLFEYSVGGMVTASPSYHRKRVYFAVEDGYIYSFE